MSNWSANPENKVTITSGSSSALYGKDASGAAMKSDETLQTGWTPIDGMKGMKINSVIGNVDQSALYAVDNQYKLNRCDGPCKDVSNVVPLETAGYAPLNLTAEPDSKQLWLTSTTSGEQGNIFSRLDKPDYSSIINIVSPLDKKRDGVVQSVEQDYQKQTEVMGVNKQLEDLQQIFYKIFGSIKGKPEESEKEIKNLEGKISTEQSTINRVSALNTNFLKIVITLIIVCLVFIFGMFFLGTTVYYIVLGVLAIGAIWIYRDDINPSDLLSYLKLQ